MLTTYRVLVAEDEPAVAEHISDLVTEAEGVVVGPAATVHEARKLLSDGVSVDLALLDVNLADGTVTPVLEALTARGVPTVLYTGADVPADLRKRHPGLVALSKPVPPARLIAELRKLVGQVSQARPR
jgi:CheY-like chemotaxis protein